MDFLGGPVVKIPCFHCRGHRSFICHQCGQKQQQEQKNQKPLFILLIASGHGAQMFPTRERCLPLFSKKDGCAVLYNLKGRYSQLRFPDEKYCGSRKPGDLLGQTGCYWWNQSSHPGGLSSWPSSFYPASVFNQS